MKEGYKITEIISAVGVLAGLSIAVYELYISDRSEEEVRRHRSYEVASRIFQYDSMRDFVDIAVEYGEPRSRSAIREFDAVKKMAARKEVLLKSFSMLSRIVEIENCISNKLCDENIALDVSCTPIIGIGREFSKIHENVPGVSQIVRERPLQRMVELCRQRVDQIL